MELSEIMNFVLGGGLATALTGLFTIRATVRKKLAEAEKAKADAEAVRIDNAEHATQVLVSNIVEPLKDELDGTRKDLLATKREMARLRKAIDRANSCKHHDDCPVLRGMRGHPEDDGGNDPDGGGTDGGGQPEERSPPGTDGGSAAVGSELGHTGRQPPQAAPAGHVQQEERAGPRGRKP